MTRTDAERLRDILVAVDAITRAEATASRHPHDRDVVDATLAAVQFHVFTIGEAVKALPRELTERRPDVPWSDIARMRDLIGHHYYKLDSEIVRATVGRPLTALHDACQSLLADLDREP